MTARMQRARSAAERTVRETLEGERREEVLADALRELLTEALRGAVKDVVEEGVREVQEESPAVPRQRGRILLAVGVGVAIGYLVAKRGSAPAW